MSLRTRLSVALVVLLLLVGLSGAASAVLLHRHDDARATRDRELVEVALVEQLRVAYLSEMGSFQAFLVSGVESQLADRKTARADGARLIQNLRSNGLTREKVATLDRIMVNAQRWRTEAVEPLIALRRSPDSSTLPALFKDSESFVLFQAIEDELDVLFFGLSGQAVKSDDDASQARRNLTRLTLGFLLLVVGMIVAAAIAGHRWITVPLLALARAVSGVQAGDLTTEIPNSGPREIALLGVEIEAMRRRIGTELAAKVRSQEGLMQNAAVLMSVRARLESTPALMPSGWSVAAGLTPATGVVAGDCYDVAWVQESRLGIVVVDVAGHGAESAVVALRAKELLRAAVRTYVDLGEGLRWVQRHLDGLAPGMFLTAFIALLDTSTGSMDYVNAGHPPALLCGSDQVTDLPLTGPIIGPFEATWGSGRVAVEPGKTLAIYTDGLIEVRNADRVEFGLERLRELVCREFDDAEDVINRCLAETSAFSTIRGHDDVTMVAVHRLNA